MTILSYYVRLFLEAKNKPVPIKSVWYQERNTRSLHGEQMVI